MQGIKSTNGFRLQIKCKLIKGSRYQIRTENLLPKKGKRRKNLQTGHQRKKERYATSNIQLYVATNPTASKGTTEFGQSVLGPARE